MAELHCILRTAKIKSRVKITQAVEHNLRLRFQENINKKLTPTNKVIFNSLKANVADATDLQKKLSSHYEGLGIKERADNVLMMEFVVSGRCCTNRIADGMTPTPDGPMPQQSPTRCEDGRSD
ncbi:hypothetical protein AVHY2522_24785 [Acidovorax sp. SUPP2522]|nr:hypothetical protein AVHY2522_24785 [Acidovorax sp. SUPP2522]